MNTDTLAAGVIGFHLCGLVVSTAAELEDDRDQTPSHGSSQHGTPYDHPRPHVIPVPIRRQDAFRCLIRYLTRLWSGSVISGKG